MSIEHAYAPARPADGAPVDRLASRHAERPGTLQPELVGALASLAPHVEELGHVDELAAAAGHVDEGLAEAAA
jgi:hypothetical protein